MQTVCLSRVLDDGIRPLWMGEKGHEATRLDVLAEALCEPEAAGEGHVDEYCCKITEPVAPHVLLEQLDRRRHLEPELETQVECGGFERHPHVCITNRVLASGVEPEMRPDVRRRVQDTGAAGRRLAAERQALLDRSSPVVPGRYDVRMDVDEHPVSLALGARRPARA